jgi:hypothetical protein
MAGDAVRASRSGLHHARRALGRLLVFNGLGVVIDSRA